MKFITANPNLAQDLQLWAEGNPVSVFVAMVMLLAIGSHATRHWF